MGGPYEVQEPLVSPIQAEMAFSDQESGRLKDFLDGK